MVTPHPRRRAQNKVIFPLLVSLWHQLWRERIREESHTKDWPLAPSRMLKAVCTVFPSDQPTCGAGWALGEGKRQELIRFPSFEVKNETEWRSSWSKAARSDKKGDSDSLGRAQAPAAKWGEGAQPSEWALLFPFRKHLKQLELAIYKSDWPQCNGSQNWYGSESLGEVSGNRDTWASPQKTVIPSVWGRHLSSVLLSSSPCQFRCL